MLYSHIPKIPLWKELPNWLDNLGVNTELPTLPFSEIFWIIHLNIWKAVILSY